MNPSNIYIKDIDIVVGCFFFFSPFGDSSAFKIVKLVFMAYLIAKYFKEYGRYPVASALLTLFALVLITSSYLNVGTYERAVSAAVYSAQIMAVFALFSANAQRLGVRRLLWRVFVVLVIVLVVNDIMLLLFPQDRLDSSNVYLVGNKFVVAYAHCLVLGIFVSLDYTRRPAAILAVALAAFLASWLVGCATGIVMVVAMLVFCLVPQRVWRLACSPVALAVAILGINLLIWGTNSIFEASWYQDFLANVLHKSSDMTGRSRLYAATFDLVSAKPWFGYGFNTDIYREMFGYGNAQNGVFHVVTQAGIVGAALFFGGLAASLARGGDCYSHGLYMYLFAMAIGSSVEINLSIEFVYGVALLCAIGLEMSQEPEHKKVLGDTLPGASRLEGGCLRDVGGDLQ